MAHTKAAGATKLGRDSQSKRLGVKIFAGQKAQSGAIIVRQNGTKFAPGAHTALARDYSIFAVTDGVVSFRTKKIPSFTGKLQTKTIVEVTPSDRSENRESRI